MVQFIATSLTILLTILLINFFSKKRSILPKKEMDGTLIFTVAKPPVYFLTGFGMLLVLGALLAFFMIEDHTLLSRWITGSLFFLFLLATYFCYWSLTQHKTIVTANYLKSISYFGRLKQSRWDQISEVKVLPIRGELIIIDTRRTRHNISQFTIGIDHILYEISQRTNIDTSALKQELFK